MNDNGNVSKKAEVEVTHEGYLQRQSLYLKKLRKRFIILRENHLFCYDNHKKTRITELINLAPYRKAQASQKEVSQIDLLPQNNRDSTLVFAAKSMEEAEEWINAINQSINPTDKIENDAAKSIEPNSKSQGLSVHYLLTVM